MQWCLKDNILLIRTAKGVLLASPLVLAIVGARTMAQPPIYACYVTCSVVGGLALAGWYGERWHKWVLFTLGLALVYQTTLMTDYLVGSDIHGEYYYAWRTYTSGHWDTSIKHAYNSSLLTGWVVPTLARITSMPLEAVFKVVLPLSLAGVPVVCYSIYRTALVPRLALASALFLIAMPVYSLEVATIGKQMVAELLFVGCLWCLVKMSGKWRWLAVGALSVSSTLVHYSIGMVLAGYLLLYPFVLWLTGRLKGERWPIAPAFGVAIVVLLISCLYLGVVAQGKALRDVTANIRSQTTSLEAIWERFFPPETEPVISGQALVDAGIVNPAEINPTELGIADNVPEIGLAGYIAHQEETVRAAVGFDFVSTTPLGKAFRIIQWITEAMIVAGLLVLFVKRRQYPSKYLAITYIGALLLAATVLVAGFSYIMNATRLYHIALLTIAPAFVVGGIWMFRRLWAVGLVLFLYFVFTSGAVFELAKVTDMQKVTIPYSLPLSAARCDITGLYTAEDVAVRDYAVENGLLPVYTDHWGAYLFYEKLGDASLQYNYYPQGWRRVANMPNFILILDLSKSYVFVRSAVEEQGYISIYMGLGIKETRTLEEVGFAELMQRGVAVSCGNSTLYATD